MNENTIDRKFKISAVNPVNGKRYTEEADSSCVPRIRPCSLLYVPMFKPVLNYAPIENTSRAST